MRKPRPGEIVPPLPQIEMTPPAGMTYLTWQGIDFVHLSTDRVNAMCGAVKETPADPLVTMDPFGKPRCLECLKLAGVDPLINEPEPVPKDVPPEENQPAQPAGQPATPALTMPPPEFFKSVRKG